jgi:hypothetical protein
MHFLLARIVNSGKAVGQSWRANFDDEYLQKNFMYGAGEFALYRSVRHVSSRAQ